MRVTHSRAYLYTHIHTQTHTHTHTYVQGVTHSRAYLYTHIHTQTHTHTHTYRESPTLMERPTDGDGADGVDPEDTQPAEIDESMRAMLEKMMRSDTPPSTD
jgi:hypothetical protein